MLYFLKIPAAYVASVPFCFPSDQGRQRFFFSRRGVTEPISWQTVKVGVFYSLYYLQEILQYIE